MCFIIVHNYWDYEWHPYDNKVFCSEKAAEKYFNKLRENKESGVKTIEKWGYTVKVIKLGDL